MQRLYIFLLMTAIFFFGLFFGYKFGNKYSLAIIGDSSTDKLSQAFSVIKDNYVDNLEEDHLTVEAIQGMLNSLDPHSTYLSAEQVRMAMEEFQGNFEGIGIEFDIVDDTLIVVAPIAGGPSEALGILSGDRIVEIDDSSAIGITSLEVIKKLRGKKGTEVGISVFRPSEPKLLSFVIVRDKIPTFSIDLSMMLNDKIGYIKLSKFVETSHEEFLQALKDLKSQGLESLVLDLRGNPGGLLDQAVMIADEFIQGGKKIVFTKSRIPSMQQTEFAQPGGQYETGGLIVLVDKGSASASEIVSGAIQDLDRGLILGERTFGKGLVQRQYPLTDGSALRVTVSRYYSPLGRKIQRDYETSSEGRLEYYAQVYNRKSFDEVEGSASDTAIKALAAFEQDSLNQVFTTASGRKIIGGGGIVPDYIATSDTLTPFTRQIRKNRIFSEFAMKVISSQGEAIKKAYGEDLLRFVHNYEITPDQLQVFINEVTKKGIKYNAVDYSKDKDVIAVILKSKIARQLWGFKGEIAVLTKIDQVLVEAQDLMPKTNSLTSKD